MVFTVFTPIYNRKKFLPQIYQSLLNQKYKDFEWLIVDDGSTDGIEAVVNDLIARNEIDIKYYYKENGGKHTAINLGVQKAKGELFIIIDSDDVLVDNALELINEQWLTVQNNNELSGIVGLSSYRNGEIVGSLFPSEIWDVHFSDIYHKYHLKGDKSVAFKTVVLKEFPFPEKEGVNFVFEAVVWHEMAKKYKVRCINRIIQFVEYQQSGLSDSSYKKWYIKGLAFSYFKLIENNTHPFMKYPKVFLWDYIYLVLYSLLLKEKYFYQLDSFYKKMVYLMVFPRAYFSYLNMKKLLKD